MVTILLHVLFTVSMGAIVTILTLLASHGLFHGHAAVQDRFLRIMLLVVAVKIAYVAMYAGYLPNRVLSTDGERYLYEAQSISSAPWKWNPLTGEGPERSQSAKMGMSYVYGWILYTFQVDSLYAILVLNVVAAMATCLVVAALTRTLCASPLPALWALVLSALHPEMLFWNARVVRENFILLLVPCLAWCAIRLHERFDWKILAGLFLSTFLLFITRVQLALFLPLIAGYFAVSILWKRHNLPLIVGTLLLVGVAAASFGMLREQIQETVGSKFTAILTLELGFWLRRAHDIGQALVNLLAVFARGNHGLVGVIVGPVFALGPAIFLLMLVNFPAIFGPRLWEAVLLVLMSVIFLLMVAATGLINIRFRSTITPLVIPLVSVALWHFWVRLGEPVLTLRRTAGSPGVATSR